ncbi:Rmf/CrpP family protein [Saccharopolyspora griseoalba]|uniref:Rmf/CrpP family protein n=1 Tax=Saccharopolyspora griseoalba TaxID=1431848 RepID=A0ABW2LTA9_9PSEU
MRQDEIIEILNVKQILTTQHEGENAALDDAGRRACPYPPASINDDPTNQALREMWLAGYRMGETRRRAAVDRELGIADPDETADEFADIPVSQTARGMTCDATADRDR